MNNFNENTPPQYSEPQPTTQMSVIAILALAFGFFLIGNILAFVLTLIPAKMLGYDLMALVQNMSENSALGDRNLTRLYLFLSHLFGFILPALATVYLAYKQLFIKYLRLDRAPNLATVFWGFIWIVASVPLVQYSYKLGKSLPLPEWMRGMEQDTNKLLEGIITKEYWYESVIMVFIIGVVPGIGEEMMFRGILQQQFGRLLKNPHVQVWLSAAVFSAIHMQFEGFFARMILGALLGYMLLWSRNLWIPVIVHALNNGLQVIAIYALNVKPSEAEKMGGMEDMPIWAAMISLFAVIGIGFFFKKWTENQSNTEGV